MSPNALLIRRVIRVCAALVVVSGLLLVSFSSGLPGVWLVHAQEPDVLPTIPPPFVPSPQAVVVERHSVEATIRGPIAMVAVTQVFRNDGTQPAEGIYVFPLPKDAAVSDFQMTVDGRTLEGRLLDRDEARAIYEEIVRTLRDPALLEYIDRGLFQASVFPIPPGETRTVEFTYTQVLETQDGLYHFNYPLSTRQYSTAPVEQVSVVVELTDLPGLRTIYSPGYPVRIDRIDDESARVSYEATRDRPTGDYDLYFGTDRSAVGLNLLSYRPAGEDGYFVLLAAPGVDKDEQEIVARDIIMVLDVSGSMQGDKIAQAREAARYVIEHLNPEDHFNLLAFSTGTYLWQRDLQPVDEDTVAAAARWIDRLDASGSTDINRSLLEALAQLQDGKSADSVRPAYILFLTDGQPTQGETIPERIVDNVLANAPEERAIRLFAFGIGYDVNTDLLDIVSQQLGGKDNYVEPDEQIDEAVSSFYAQISTPVLANLALDFGADRVVDDVFPYPLPDLFAGEQLVVVGRYQDGGTLDVTLTGDVNGVERMYVYPDQTLAEEGGEPFVARLWATRKLGALLEQVRRTGASDELVDAIVDLSLRYGIVTPYTSYLVEEPEQPLVAGTEGMIPFDLHSVDSLQERARSEVLLRADTLAAGAPTGAAAVKASEAREELLSAQIVGQDQAVRYVGGRTFRFEKRLLSDDGRTLEFWLDTAYDEAMDVTMIEFGTEAYFDLLDEPGMAEWLAISPELLIVVGENAAIRITTLEE